jgi:hypothetical protein
MCEAAVYILNSPTDINNPSTITFDGYSHLTVANILYQGQGITFTRDDGQPVFIDDYSSRGETITSPNVLATFNDPPLTSAPATQLNVISSQALYAIGAYFGNDDPLLDYAFTRLSVYGSSGELLGSVQVPVNGNVSVDQFIGIASDIPFTQARFENFNSAGAPSALASVVIDNLSFSSVPEPATISLFAVLASSVIILRKRRG